MKQKLKKYLLKKGGPKMSTTTSATDSSQQITNDLISKYSTADTTKSTTTAATKTLGKDEFMKLLMTELKYQDPTSPMDNKELVAQQAQFSSLEQMTNLNTSFTNFLAQQSTSSQMSAVNFIGKTVTTTLPINEEGTKFLEGKVTSIKFSNNEYVFKVGDKEVKMSDITNVSGGTAS